MPIAYSPNLKASVVTTTCLDTCPKIPWVDMQVCQRLKVLSQIAVMITRQTSLICNNLRDFLLLWMSYSPGASTTVSVDPLFSP